jgi:hypothetical protein
MKTVMWVLVLANVVLAIWIYGTWLFSVLDVTYGILEAFEPH